MELIKYSEFVYGILVLLAWMTHTDLKKSYLLKRPSKTAKQGLVWEQGGCFLTPAAKASHKPTQPVTQGVPA